MYIGTIIHFNRYKYTFTVHQHDLQIYQSIVFWENKMHVFLCYAAEALHPPGEQVRGLNQVH
jgi:hypothetical protein